MPASTGRWARKARSQVVLQRGASAWFVWILSGHWVICQPERSVHTTGLVWQLAEVPWCIGRAGTDASAMWVDKKERSENGSYLQSTKTKVL